MTPEEFIKIWQEVELPKNVLYRLYHDDDGFPLFYSMEDLPGNYIDIDQETYHQSPRNIRVRNGKIVYQQQKISHKLVPGVTGTPCDPRDVCVVVSPSSTNTRWSKKIYEQN